MGGPHGPRTHVHEGARAIKVSMSCYDVRAGVLWRAGVRTDQVECLVVRGVSVRRAGGKVELVRIFPSHQASVRARSGLSAQLPCNVCLNTELRLFADVSSQVVRTVS